MRIVFIICGLAGVAFILTKLLPGFQLTSEPLDTFSASGSLSAEAVALLDRTKALALEMVAKQNFWKAWAFWLAIGALACTTLATFVAAMRAKESRDREQEFLNKKITAIGALSALATLLASGGELVDSQKVETLDTGITTLKKVLVNVPADISASPENQPAILDALEVTLAEFDH